MTIEYLGYRPEVLEQAKTGYSPLGKFFNDELKEGDKNTGFWKA